MPLWYHTIEVAPGVATPGWFDLRPIIELMPWPGCAEAMPRRRHLDGFLAFELERRGAAEVVAADIESHDDWDWPPLLRERGTPEQLGELAGREQGKGFAVAKRLRGSSVERVGLHPWWPRRGRSGPPAGRSARARAGGRTCPG